MASATARAARPIKSAPTAPQPKVAGADSEIRVIVRELATVADYIGHIKKEIAALKPNELSRDRIPSANDELGNVIQTTASATHTIMAAAEEILGAGALSDKAYRDLVETRVLAIFEACSFQDITGQRIGRVLEGLGQLEKRLDRFAKAVNVRDSSEGPDPEEALRQARREVLLLNGPQNEDAAIKQDDIDALFD
jgi:chemotaxis protein CheZ